MDDNEPKLNWLERRRRMERHLSDESENFWNEVRTALQDVSETYKNHYCQEPRELVCTAENAGFRLRITKLLRRDNVKEYQEGKRKQLVVSFNRDVPEIEVTYPTSGEKIELASDGQTVYAVLHEERVDADGLSQAILENFLFGTVRERQAVTPRPGGGGPHGWMG